MIDYKDFVKRSTGQRDRFDRRTLLQRARRSPLRPRVRSELRTQTSTRAPVAAAECSRDVAFFVIMAKLLHARFDRCKMHLRQLLRSARYFNQSLTQKAACVCENGDFRVPERSVLLVREHRNAENRHLQPHRATFGTGSQANGTALVPKGNFASSSGSTWITTRALPICSFSASSMRSQITCASPTLMSAATTR